MTAQDNIGATAEQSPVVDPVQDRLTLSGYGGATIAGLLTYDADGQVVLPRETYNALRKHDYAGMDGDRAWVLAMDHTGATCLWSGLRIAPTLSPEGVK